MGPADPAKQFIASMVMNFDMWHDGLGYDLDALRRVPPDELPAIEAELLSRRPPDWRDIEALALIDTPAARAAVKEAATSSDAAVRRVARRALPAEAVEPDARVAALVKSLETVAPFGGLDATLSEVEEFHPPPVIDALLLGARSRPGDVAVHFAAMLYFLHGKAAEPFDWDHRPFFLRFHDTGVARKAVFRELCDTIGVDADRYEPEPT